MWAWGGGVGEELAWEDGMGSSQARQSMKQLTGAGKGGAGRRGEPGRGFGILEDAAVTRQGAERDKRMGQRLVAKVLGVQATFSSN